MATIETLDQYEELAARAAERYWNRELSVRVGMASCGLAAGALSVYEAASARESPAADGLTVSRVGCRGSCMVEPMVELVRPDYHLIFHAVTPEDVNAIIDGAKRDDFGSFEAEGRVWQERQSLRTDGAPFVTRWRRRTVAKGDSMTFVVRRCTQCSAGKSKKASNSASSRRSEATAFGYLAP